MTRGFNLDQDGNLSVDIFNPFGMNEETINIGDEDHTEPMVIFKVFDLSNSNKDSEIL